MAAASKQKFVYLCMYAARSVRPVNFCVCYNQILFMCTFMIKLVQCLKNLQLLHLIGIMDDDSFQYIFLNSSLKKIMEQFSVLILLNRVFDLIFFINIFLFFQICFFILYYNIQSKSSFVNNNRLKLKYYV